MNAEMKEFLLGGANTPGTGYEDARVADWWGIGDIKLPLAITLAYLCVPILGVRYMRDREPINPPLIKKVALVHNLILFLLSCYMVVETLRCK